MDERIKKLAKNIISYSLNLQKGERLLIEAKDCNPTIIKALVAEAAFFGLAAFALIAKTARSASVKIFFM